MSPRKKKNEPQFTMKWKSTVRLNSKVSVEVTYNFLTRIAEENGGQLPPDEVVRQSRPKDAPLHNEFEWNNAKAADKYRIEQAKYLIRHIEVVPLDPSLSPVRAYHSIPVEIVNPNPTETSQPTVTKQVYRSIEDILSDPQARDDLLMAAIRDANTFKRKYSVLQEWSQVIQVMEKTVAQFA